MVRFYLVNFYHFSCSNYRLKLKVAKQNANLKVLAQLHYYNMSISLSLIEVLAQSGDPPPSRYSSMASERLKGELVRRDLKSISERGEQMEM